MSVGLVQICEGQERVTSADARIMVSDFSAGYRKLMSATRTILVAANRPPGSTLLNGTSLGSPLVTA